MYGAAVRRRFVAFVQAVVAQHLGHAQAIVGEDAFAPRRLRLAVLLVLAPGFDRGGVPPERQREDLARFAEALETFDGDEAGLPVQISHHKAAGREIYANGALRCAQWLMDKPSGLFDMQDVLGLKA